MRHVGILGGGQLGTMLAEALFHLDAPVTIYDADPTAPAIARFADVVVSPWSDLEAVEKFAKKCEIVTYEFEHIESGPLRALSGGPPIVPSVEVLEITQDRAREKQFLARNELPHVSFVVVRSEEELRGEARRFGWPFILKTIRGGYDGKGQFHIAGHEDLEAAILALRERKSDFHCVLEELIDLELEVSCIVARGNGEAVFPLFENAHSGHILDLTVVPARVPPDVARVVQEVALRTAQAIELVGLLTIEFFIGRRAPRRSHAEEASDLYVYVNELAPRPHNSGHVTRNACTFSQYDALARVLAGVPLTPPQMNGDGAWCMANLLGDVWIAQNNERLDLSCWKDHPAVVDIVLYGKRAARARRKMGHFVTHAKTPAEAIDAARRFREALSAP
jgi:5-(carboxyamino)imidazole ribonucleotide synthase